MKNFIIGFFLFIAAFPASAASYQPGTVGFLYEDCQKALENSTTLEQLHATACGAFAEGYVWGFLVTSSLTLKESQPGNPCNDENRKEYERINNRMCKNFPVFDVNDLKAGTALHAVAEIVTRWLDFEKARSGKRDTLKRGTVRQMNEIAKPGPFCDDMATSYPVQKSRFIINPALEKIKVKDFLETAGRIAPSAKFEQCKKDVGEAHGDSQNFLATRCGAEISGFIAGLYSIEHLQKNRTTPSRECKKEINRLYKSLDFTNTMCVNADTNPLWVAEVFLRRYAQGIRNTRDIQGGIGYQVIYKGFLCAENESRTDIK